MPTQVNGKSIAQAVAEAAKRAQIAQDAARKAAADIAAQRQVANGNGAVQGQQKGQGS